MTTNDFKKALTACLREYGFAKEGTAYYRRTEELIVVIALQRSNFQAAYYINVGYLIRDIHHGEPNPRYYHGDVRARFGSSCDGKWTDLFDPSMLTTTDDLRSIVERNCAELFDGVSGITGLKALLDRRPVMLYQTTSKAKKALGIEEAS